MSIPGYTMGTMAKVDGQRVKEKRDWKDDKNDETANFAKKPKNDPVFSVSFRVRSFADS